MRWISDNREYDTDEAAEIAHAGRDNAEGEPRQRLYKTDDGRFFTVTQDPDGDYPHEVAFSTLTARAAWYLYLSLPVHVVSEDDAFPSVTEATT